MAFRVLVLPTVTMMILLQYCAHWRSPYRYTLRNISTIHPRRSSMLTNGYLSIRTYLPCQIEKNSFSNRRDLFLTQYAIEAPTYYCTHDVLCLANDIRHPQTLLWVGTDHTPDQGKKFRFLLNLAQAAPPLLRGRIT